jgi:DNA-binding transcriptional ArsR family regulator
MTDVAGLYSFARMRIIRSGRAREEALLVMMTPQTDMWKSPRLNVALESDGDYQWCADRLKALADPDRLRIVNRLLSGAKNVTELAAELGVSTFKISHHLRVLRHAYVVQTQKAGKFVVYSLCPEIAAGKRLAGTKTLDFGCCRIELPQPRGGH